ncbi:MAG: hypothetical protein KDK33_12035 [Leptospiraceae bacterium]|nr:hypothetical protein [Leptospiraceae bacterium]
MSTKKKSSNTRVSRPGAKSAPSKVRKAAAAKKAAGRAANSKSAPRRSGKLPGAAPAMAVAQEAEINPQQRLFASRPTGFTLWLRRSLIWQSIRFIVINIRMLFMISKAQPSRIKQ